MCFVCLISLGFLAGPSAYAGLPADLPAAKPVKSGAQPQQPKALPPPLGAVPLKLGAQLLPFKQVVCREFKTGKPVVISKKILPVFKKDKSLQCDKKTGISLKVMKKQITGIGIKVFRSVKGRLAGSRQISVCGAPTHYINIFYIPLAQASKAFKKGFKSCVRKS